MILKKLTSKKGQVSMEIGILVAAAVAVAAIAAYFYTTNVKESAKTAGSKAGNATEKMGQLAESAISSMDTDLS